MAQIAPIPEGVPRPFWSVMIPTFNCASYLRQTLESVLMQDAGPMKMQIEVVDDCSERDDPERVVREVGGNRVEFFRQPKNVGHVANFLTCLRRSRGHIIHLLHGDDYVRSGFYAKMEKVFSSNPAVGAACCRQIFADENGHWLRFSTLEMPKAGIWQDVAQLLPRGQRIQTPSMVVKREVYERLGAFDPKLTWTEDWEMWVRIAVNYPIWFDPEPVAVYREHGASSSSRQMLTGENVRDSRRCIATFKNYFPADEQAILVAAASQSCAQYAIACANTFFLRGQNKAAMVQLCEALKCSCRPKLIYRVAGLLFVQGIRISIKQLRMFCKLGLNAFRRLAKVGRLRNAIVGGTNDQSPSLKLPLREYDESA